MVLLNWGWIGFALVALVAGFIGGCEHEKREFDLYKAKVEAAVDEQKRETEKINERNKEKTKEVASDYERRIAAIRAAYRGMHNDGTCPVPGPAEASGGIDARPSYDVLAESCAETTQQLISLQQFERETQ